MAERLLLVKRYSGDDKTGALERQDELLDTFAKGKLADGAVMAEGPGGGWVEDETVSGSINLDERRELGQWMRPPLLDNWDTMVVSDQERITRDDIHWWNFVGKLREWGKSVAVLDDPNLDLTTTMGRLQAGFKAAQATEYRLFVSEKKTDANESFRRQQRFVGGWWPYGLRAEPRSDGIGWSLVHDPTTSEHVREMVQRVIGGDSLKNIAKDFNDRGIPTGKDHQAATRALKPGETRPEPKGYRWTESSVTKVLRSPALLGHPTHKGEVIREDGLPVRWWEPLVEPEDYYQVQSILDRNGEFRRGILGNRSDLLGVTYCGCGFNHTHKTDTNKQGRKYQYYRCGRYTHPNHKREGCPLASRSWPEEFVKSWLEDAFLDELGDEEVTTRKFIPGRNRDPEIKELQDAIENLSGNLANLPPGSRAAQGVIDKITDYENKLSEIEAEPTTPSRWERKGTGVTYRERWKETDWPERGQWLYRLGIRAVFNGTPEAPNVHLVVPEDIREAAPGAIAGTTDSELMTNAESWIKDITS